MSWAAGDVWAEGDAGRWACTVVCTGCGGPAEALPVRARSLQSGDRAAFAALADFTLIDDEGGTLALYHEGLGARPLAEIPLPPGYAPEDWVPRWRGGTAGPLGEYAVHCPRCGRREARQVAWPADSYYQIEYRAQVLWAWDRAQALVLLDYVAGDDRRLGLTDPNLPFLKRIPTHFLTAKARETIVKRLTRRIGEVGR